MGFLAETILENIKGFGCGVSCEKYILDIKLEELMDMLNVDGKVVVKLPLNEENNKRNVNYPYLATITKDDIDIKLWKVSIKVEEYNKGEEGANVLYETYMHKPKKET